jgi:hypothetical protein
LKACAPGVLDLNRNAIGSAILDQEHHASVQALAPRVIHPNLYTIEQARAAGVFRFSRDDFASMFFHFGLHALGLEMRFLARDADVTTLVFDS